MNTLEDYKKALQEVQQQLQQLSIQEQRIIGGIQALQQLQEQEKDTNE